MRIAINALAVGPKMTGVGGFTLELIRSLAAVDADNEYVVFEAECDLLAALELPANFRLVSVRAEDATRDRRRYPTAGLMWEQVRLPKLLDKLSIDVYHSSAITLPVRSSLGNTRALMTLHDTTPEEYPDVIDPWYVEFFRKWAVPSLARADRFLAVSEYTKGRFVSRYGIEPERVDVVYQSVDPAFFAARGSDAATRPRGDGDGDGDGYLLHVGLIEPWKEVHTLIAAAGKLVERGRRLRVVVVGPVSERSDYRPWESAPENMGGRISVRGYLEVGELARLVRGAAAVVIASRHEGFGRPAAEAMAAGTPVVVADNSSLPEVVGKGGLVFRTGDAGELAETLDRLLSDAGLWQRMVEYGTARSELFRQQRFGSAVVRIYERAQDPSGQGIRSSPRMEGGQHE